MAKRTSQLVVAVVAGVGLLASCWPASAQQAPGFNPQRDCQTVRTCNWSRSGSWRGCLSSHSCRVCKLVPGRCGIAGSSPSQKTCMRMRCTWG